jgi:hypothetical protein
MTERETMEDRDREDRDRTKAVEEDRDRDREDRVRTKLRELIKRSGFSHTEVSSRVGMNHAYIHQFLRQGRPTHLPAPVRFALGRLLGVDPDELREPDESQPTRRVGLLRPELEARLVQRTTRVVDTLATGWNPQIEAEVFAAVYTLLERERRGYPITDDADTLTIIRRMLERIVQAAHDTTPTKPTT